MRDFETTIIQCHVRWIFFFYFVIFSQWGGQEMVHSVAKKGVVLFLAFSMVWEAEVGEHVGICGEVFLYPFPCCFWWMITKQDLGWRIEFPLNLSLALSMLNKTVLFLCILIRLFAGKLSLNSCVFPSKDWRKEAKKKKKILSNCPLVLVCRWDLISLRSH